MCAGNGVDPRLSPPPPPPPPPPSPAPLLSSLQSSLFPAPSMALTFLEHTSLLQAVPYNSRFSTTLSLFPFVLRLLIPRACVRARAHTHTHTAIGVTDGRVARAVLLYVLVLAQTCVDLRHLFARPLLHEGYPSVCSCAQACAVNLCDICTSLCAQYICVISVYLYARRERECLRVSVPVSAPVSQHLSAGVCQGRHVPTPVRLHAFARLRPTVSLAAPSCIPPLGEKLRQAASGAPGWPYAGPMPTRSSSASAKEAVRATRRSPGSTLRTPSGGGGEAGWAVSCGWP